VRHSLAVVLLSFALASASLAEEQLQPETPPGTKPLGVEFSLRLGPAATNLGLVSGPLFPLSLGVGYRFGGLVYVGVAGVYAFGPTETFGGQAVSIYNTQFLAEVAIHPLRYAKIDPWIGYGLGVEWFNGGTGNFVPVSFSMGVDFAVSHAFRMGPFFTLQVAFNGNDTHEWYVVGLKLTALP
jgi:hypothetical protein